MTWEKKTWTQKTSNSHTTWITYCLSFVFISRGKSFQWIENTVQNFGFAANLYRYEFSVFFRAFLKTEPLFHRIWHPCGLFLFVIVLFSAADAFTDLRQRNQTVLVIVLHLPWLWAMAVNILYVVISITTVIFTHGKEERPKQKYTAKIWNTSRNCHFIANDESLIRFIYFNDINRW